MSYTSRISSPVGVASTTGSVAYTCRRIPGSSPYWLHLMVSSAPVPMNTAAADGAPTISCPFTVWTTTVRMAKWSVVAPFA